MRRLPQPLSQYQLCVYDADPRSTMRLPMKELYLLSMVVSLSIVGCSGHTTKISPTINPNASLVGDLPANSLQWKVVTSAVNTEDSTMSTLYGNDLAAGYARTNSRHNYPNGSVLSLVTWTQRDDDRWFGARIPDQVKSVEFVFVGVAADGRPLYSYQEYEGKPLKRGTAQEGRTLNDRGHIFCLSEQLAR